MLYMSYTPTHTNDSWNNKVAISPHRIKSDDGGVAFVCIAIPNVGRRNRPREFEMLQLVSPLLVDLNLQNVIHGITENECEPGSDMVVAEEPANMVMKTRPKRGQRRSL